MPGLLTLFGPAAPAAGPGTRVLRLDLGDWDYAPFMWPYLARDAELSWNPANISAVRIYLESGEATSEKVLLGSTSGVVYTKLAGDAHEYMGDWGLDHGFPYIADAGFDTNASGTSIVPPVDPEYRIAFKLLPGITGRFLRIEIDITDVGLPVEIDYPRLLLGNADFRVYPMGRNNQIVIQENGPGVNHAGSSYYVSGLQIPPIPQGRTTSSSILDMLCDRRSLFEGVHPETGGSPDLPTELTQLFDTTEGQGYGQVESSDSLGFLLPLAAPNFAQAIVNCRAEMPPISCLPRGDRAAAGWAEIKTTWVGKVWVWARERRLLVSAGGEAQLFDPGGVQISALDGTFGQWNIAGHVEPVDNDEGLDYEIRVDKIEYANVRPWHNFFGVLPTTIDTGDGAVSIDCGLDHMWHRAFVLGGAVYAGRTDNRIGIWEDAAVGVVGDSCCIRVQRRRKDQTIWLAIDASGTVVLYESPDGLVWTLSATFGTGTNPQIVVGLDNLRFLYWCEGGGIHGVILDAAGNILEAEFTAIATADNAQFGVDEGISDGRSRQINILCAVGGVLTLYSAPDGKTFS